ncbi:hypothetical protein ASE04_11705 [Rhizobium sp. Root708]|uniref:GumC family protein n=1 Tax=Rhizobium sp. Root708 TaxID=1736592 RepID=UPI0007001635|nr:hypothetical protein [Rhizobium sp. Root708]KRB51426.1 hypothetical protein ASE04_11705 [Rhizobium sp. Root708]
MNKDFLIRNAQYYFDLLLAKKTHFLIPFLIILLCGMAVVLQLPRSYYSQAVLIVEGQQIPSTLVPATVTNERLQLIEQRVLARDSLLDLAERQNLFPALAQTLSKSKFADLIRLAVTITSETPEGADPTSASSVVHVGFKYGDPKVAAAVTSDLIDMLMNETKRIRVSRATETAQFLTRETEDLDAKLKQKEAYRDKFVEENKDVMPNRVPQLLIELQERERDLSSLETAITSQNEEVSLLQAQLRLGIENSADTTRRRAQLAQLQTQINEKLLIYSESHPQIRALKQKIDLLKSQAAAPQEAGAETANADPVDLPPELALVSQRVPIAKARQAALLQQRDQVRAKISAIKMDISRAPDIEAQMNAIDIERTGLQRSLDDMKSKLETARTGERLESGESAMQIEVIETPDVPLYPTQSRMKFMIVVLVLSLAAGMGTVLLADLLTPTIRGTFDLAESLGGQTLVVLPEWTPPDPSGSARRGWFGSVRKFFSTPTVQSASRT